MARPVSDSASNGTVLLEKKPPKNGGSGASWQLTSQTMRTFSKPGSHWTISMICPGV